MATNIWRERKVHIARDGPGSKPLCGASGNAVLKTKVAYGSIPPLVSCERCLKLYRPRGERP